MPLRSNTFALNFVNIIVQEEQMEILVFIKTKSGLTHIMRRWGLVSRQQCGQEIACRYAIHGLSQCSSSLNSTQAFLQTSEQS